MRVARDQKRSWILRNRIAPHRHVWEHSLMSVLLLYKLLYHCIGDVARFWIWFLRNHHSSWKRKKKSKFSKCSTNTPDQHPFGACMCVADNRRPLVTNCCCSYSMHFPRENSPLSCYFFPSFGSFRFNTTRMFWTFEPRLDSSLCNDRKEWESGF